MSADKPDAKKPDDKKAAAPAAGGGGEAAEISARVTQYQEEITALEKEVKILEGKFNNRNPQVIAAIKADNDVLKARLKNIQTAYFALTMDALLPRTVDDFKTRNEALRLASIAFFEKLKLDPNLWKSIASS